MEKIGELIITGGEEKEYREEERWSFDEHVNNIVFIIMAKAELLEKGASSKIGPQMTLEEHLEKLKQTGGSNEQINFFKKSFNENQAKMFDFLVNEFNSNLREIGKDPAKLREYGEKFLELLKK